MYSTRCAQQTAIDAVQLFGGRGITQRGMGRLIEHVRNCFLDLVRFADLGAKYYRTVPFDALLGGGKLICSSARPYLTSFVFQRRTSSQT